MPDTLEHRLMCLRDRLGAAKVDALVEAAGVVGASRLPGDENLAFGFVQRALVHLRNSGRSMGMIFPKLDEQYRRFFDYFDGQGGIWVIHPGTGPGEMRVEPDWFRPLDLGPSEVTFYEVAPGRQLAIVTAFLEAYADLASEGTA